FVFCSLHALVLETIAGQGEKLSRHLDRYLIREQVEIQDHSDAWGELLLAGAEAESLLHEMSGQTLHELSGALPSQTLGHVAARIAQHAIWIRRVEIAGPGGFLIAGSREAIDAAAICLAAEGAAPCSAHALETVRIEAGFPFYGQDIGEKNLPQE